MKILLAHNYYGSAAPSGENQVFEAERELLRSRGHELLEFTRHSDTLRAQGAIGKLIGAALTPWNNHSYRTMQAVVAKFRPDVVHVHNTFPLLSPAIFHAIGDCSRRVLTLHNYRIFCPAAIPMRDGNVCTECLDDRNVWPALQHGCYRNSHIATLPLAVSVALHRCLGTWTRQVDAFIALTEFQRERMVNVGLPSEKVFVKPNFYPGNPAVIAWDKRTPAVVFVGRLTAEKGVTSLVKAWALWGENAPQLKIVGDGELRDHLENLAQGLPIHFLGQVSSQQAQQEIAQSQLLVLPSEWFEGFPMVVREAFAFGTPAAVSNLGSLPTIVKHGHTGVNFEPGNPESLFQVVKAVWQSPALLAQLAQNARKAFEEYYTEEANYNMLINIYAPSLQTQKWNLRE